MLVELSIHDLALIEEVDLALGPGLNAVTGETGAGKSLFVGALELLRGETPRGGAARWVRKGTGAARVEGRFELADPATIAACREVLREELPAVAEAWASEGSEAELILGRTLTAEGKTRAHVQQRPVPLRALRALAPLVLEIHGQNDHQRLLSPAEQLRLLDAFGKLDPALERYAAARAGWRALDERFRRLDAERADRRDRADLLRFQRGELESAALEAGEHARLDEERELLRSAGELRAELGGLVHAWAEGEDATIDGLRAAERALERWGERLPRLAGALEDLRGARLHLEEASASVGSLLDGVEDDPARLESVEARLAELERLEHKYRTGEAGLVELAATIAAELEALEREEESLGSLEEELAGARATTERAAGALAKKRRALAPQLTRAVVDTLGDLGLARARLDVRFIARDGDEHALERFGPRGHEDVELLLAANPGEELQPLRAVASGGEAARIMLALRTVLGSGARGRTLVFDEIDAGVGGRLGPEVGRHLRALAEGAQVLCVTHVPAIAALAHSHLRTTKEVLRGRTRTTIESLAGDARVGEVADMIAGGADEETARAEARRLLQEAAP